ncbi:MAG: YdcF family protein [Candidatus Peregrinibacteria bacterium]
MIPHAFHFRLALKAALFCFLLMLDALLLAAFIVLFQSGGTASIVQFPFDCAVVFGAAVHGESDAGPGITRRTLTAVQLAQHDDIKNIILTGGKGSAGQESEAQVMRKVAMRAGMPPERIILEEKADSTWQNLRYSKPLTRNCKSVVAISDSYHLARIRLLAFRQGWGDIATYPAFPAPSGAFQAVSVLRESIALLYYVSIDGGTLDRELDSNTQSGANIVNANYVD